MTIIADYGCGNLFSLVCSLQSLGFECEVSGEKHALLEAERVILPGVGAFGDAAAALRESGLIPVIREFAEKEKPLLGICLGMQLLFERSFEFGEHEGLGLLRGDVVPLKPDLDDPSLKVPHMGWNSLEFSADDPLLGGVERGDFVYYVHSFYVPNGPETLAYSEYGGAKISGVVRCGNVWGTQFHPEKSGEVGLKMLKNFGGL